ncbi:uncharacterized protein LOC106177959 [Lingula anatina]|uniref:Uncharacterized protein LOC106177959 n=1 Tax=Lingula anatina TaxID=7574 RepID=A0A1S3K271_LINAN|nr:uncharacterized protein LOC106177959 [Lingula anatina]|eukprot:XP_013416371.1 uncharacterized protein LOC106177959 [Lingula anatina]
MQKCCFCCNLRQGTITSTIYSLILSGIVLAYMAYVIYLVEIAKQTVNQAYRDLQGFGDGGMDTSMLVTLPAIPLYAFTGLYGLWFIFSIIAMVGVCTKVRGMLLPWVIVTAIISAIEVAWIVLTFLKVGFVLVFFIILGIMAIFLALNIYAMVGVCFYFRELGVSEEQAGGQQFIPLEHSAGQPQGMYYPQQASAPPDYKEKDQPPNY